MTIHLDEILARAITASMGMDPDERLPASELLFWNLQEPHAQACLTALKDAGLAVVPIDEGATASPQPAGHEKT